MRDGLSGGVAVALVAVGSAVLAGVAPAQGWKPERNIELVIPTSPGGSNDIAGRLVHKLWTELKLLPVPSSVANRSGGEHIVGMALDLDLVPDAGDPAVRSDQQTLP